MKQQLAGLLCIAAVFLTGCSTLYDWQAQFFPAVVEEEEKEPVTPKGSWQDASYLPEALASMVEPADAILMALAESTEAYAPKDPDFFWHALSLFLGMYSENHLLVEVTDSSLRVPRKVAQEFATALYYDYDDLLEIPESRSDFVTYSDAEDAFYLGRGDRGLSETVITRWAKEDDGTYYLEAELHSCMDETVIQKAVFLVKENEYTDGMTNPTYFYSIADVICPTEEP